jgi:hypothetical protein
MLIWFVVIFLLCACRLAFRLGINELPSPRALYQLFAMVKIASTKFPVSRRRFGGIVGAAVGDVCTKLMMVVQTTQ